MQHSYRVRQTLTDKTSFSGTSPEQWGTEEAALPTSSIGSYGVTTINGGRVGDGATVTAILDGNIANSSTTANAVSVRVEISLDGGSTWNQGTLRFFRGESATANAENDCTRMHMVTGNITGEVQARAMATCGAGASAAYDLTGGVIYLEVLITDP